MLAAGGPHRGRDEGASSAAEAIFPYPFREHQEDLLSFLHRSLASGRHAVVESGTGTGKTVCALSAALAVARDQGKRVLYLTRTNSQAKQVMVEYRKVRGRLGGRGTAIALQGRQHLCPLRREVDELGTADAEELGVMCRDRMKAAEAVAHERQPRHDPCRHHLRGLVEGSEALRAWARDAAPEAEELAARVESAGQCPFVVSRSLLPEAELVVAPYVYFLHPHLRPQLLRMMGAAPSDLVVIVDEAHNLAQQARDLASPALTLRTLARAHAETRVFGDPTVLRDVPLSGLLESIARVLQEVRDEHLPEGQEDALLPPEALDVALLSALRTSTPALDRALALMGEYGASVREARRREGKRPRSDVANVAGFLHAYRGLDASTHAPIVESDGEDARLLLQALDPSVLTYALDEAFATAHVSGTLTPLEEHRDSVGLPRDRADLARFPSPFPPGNRLVVVDEEVTTRHEDLARDPGMWIALGERLRAIRAATDRNVAVFLPSYEALHRLAPYVAAKGTFVETRGTPQDALMAGVASFKATRGGTLVCVIGGRVSEGIDFPDDQLEVVVIVGLPYPKPTAKLEALVRFYERRFGQGWAWAVRAPTTRKVLQAAGRLIRSPTDRGVVALLDRRAGTMRDALPHARGTRDPAFDVARFFGAVNVIGERFVATPEDSRGPPSRRP